MRRDAIFENVLKRRHAPNLSRMYPSPSREGRVSTLGSAQRTSCNEQNQGREPEQEDAKAQSRVLEALEGGNRASLLDLDNAAPRRHVLDRRDARLLGDERVRKMGLFPTDLLVRRHG